MIRMSVSRTLAVMLAAAAAACAADAPVAWEETFDSPDCLQKARFYVWDRHNQGGWDDKLLVKEFEDGVFRYGLEHDATRKTDWVNLVYGNIVWGHKTWPDWGPFDLKQYPILEIKWRGVRHFPLYYGKETGSGEKVQDYTYPTVTRKETDAAGREWNISVIRFAVDSSAPGPHSPTRLLGINPQITTPTDGDADILELDYIRMRGFTEEEAAKEAKVIETLSGFPKARWQGLDTFFPWGLYGTGFLRNDFEWWAGDYEGAYGIYSRNHINFIATNYEVEISRVGGSALSTDEWPQAVARYAAAVKPLIQSARDNGLRRAGDMRYLLGTRDAAEGYKQILPIARQITQQVHADDDIVVAWTLADEPGVEKLLELACCLRALTETDPHKRPGLVVFNTPHKLAAYVPYLPINYWDSYPVHGGNRAPWYIRKVARDYRKLLPDVPMWPILQAFETMPPNDGSYTRPSDAEMRLMTYLSIAEGAKGIVWFHGYGAVRDVHLLHRTGYPHGNMLRTVSTLGKQLIPLGRQFIGTDPDDDVAVQVTQTTEPGDAEHLLAVSPLKYRDGSGWLLVAVNEDIDRVRAGDAVLPEAMLTGGRGVYDLYRLDGRDLVDASTFGVEPLAGGDARIYAVCDEAAFRSIRAQIQCDDAVETVRALMPDLAIARRWGLDVSPVDALMTACRSAAQESNAEQALAAAAEAAAALASLTDGDSALSMTRRALEDMQVDMDEVWRICEYPSDEPQWWTGRAHPMLIPNPSFLGVSKRYWEAGRMFRDAYTGYVKGDRDGLWQRVNAARVACLEAREDALAMLREKLKPEKDPE